MKNQYNFKIKDKNGKYKEIKNAQNSKTKERNLIDAKELFKTAKITGFIISQDNPKETYKFIDGIEAKAIMLDTLNAKRKDINLQLRNLLDLGLKINLQVDTYKSLERFKADFETIVKEINDFLSDINDYILTKDKMNFKRPKYNFEKRVK